MYCVTSNILTATICDNITSEMNISKWLLSKIGEKSKLCSALKKHSVKKKTIFFYRVTKLFKLKLR